MDAMNASATITIKNRTYKVEPLEIPARNGKPASSHYLLTGKKGAQYVTWTYRDQNFMYLTEFGGNFKADPLGRVVLTDRDGKLEVA